MKKNIIKVVIAVILIIGAVVGFNNESKANINPPTWGHVACSYYSEGCILCDGTYWKDVKGLGNYCDLININ